MKKDIITTIIVLAIIIFGVWAITKDNSDVEEEIAKCIGENSVLFVRTGCSACETQKNMFGKNYEELTIIDCLTNQQECLNNEITSIPTWIINERKYIGVQDINKLKSLTNC